MSQSQNKKILLSSIVELRELFDELNDPKRGLNPFTAAIIHEISMERIERYRSGEFDTKPSDSGTDEDSDGSS